MHRTTVLALSALALTTLLGGPAVATGNQPPLADAGLDQSVERGATVQLDANGSRDPDGTVASVAWTIETPDGTTRTPDCPSCAQTTFSPTDTGQYNVTVTVTDDAGVSRSDTLRVEVVAPGGPSISLTAPPAVPTGSRRNLTATVSAGDADLRTLAWVVNDTARNQTRLAGDNGTSTITHTFDDAGSVSVRAVAYDAAGRRGVANRTVQVVDSSGGGGGGGGGGGSCPGGSGGYYVNGENLGCTSAAMTIDDTIVDTDGRDGLWVYVDSELTKIAAEDELDELSIRGYGGTFSAETVDQLQEESRDEEGDSGGHDTDNNDDDDASWDTPARSEDNDDRDTRPGSSVPSNLMNPDGTEDEKDAEGGNGGSNSGSSDTISITSGSNNSGSSGNWGSASGGLGGWSGF